MAKNQILVQLAQIRAENEQFNTAFKSMEKTINNTKKMVDKDVGAINQTFVKFNNTLKMFGAGLAIGTVVSSLVRDMDRIKQKAVETGLSIEAFQTFDYIARNNSTSVDALVGSQTRLNIKLGEANEKGGESARLFTRLGISIDEMNRMAEDEKLSYVMSKVIAAENPTQAFAEATKILGAEAMKTKEALFALGKGYEEIAKQAQEANQITSAAAIEGMEIATKGISNLATSAKVVGQNFIGIFANLNNIIIGFFKNEEALDSALARGTKNSYDFWNSVGMGKAWESIYPDQAKAIKASAEETKKAEQAQRDMNAEVERLKKVSEESYGALQVSIKTLITNGYVPLQFKMLELESQRKRIEQDENLSDEQRIQALKDLEAARQGLMDTSKKAAIDYINSQKTEEQKYLDLQDKIKDLIKLHPEYGDSLKKALESADPALKKRISDLNEINKEINQLNVAGYSPEERKDEQMKALEYYASQTDSEGNKKLTQAAYDAEMKRINEEYQARTKKEDKKDVDPMFAKDTADWMQKWDSDSNGTITKQLELLKVQLDAGKISWEEYTKAVRGAQDSYESFGFIGDALRDGLMEISEAVVTNFQNIGDVVKQVIMKIIQQYIMLKIIGGFGSNFGGSGAGTGIMGSIGNVFSGVKTAAKGGSMEKGDWSWVGEEGPELVNFSNPARVYSSEDSKELASGKKAEPKFIWAPTIYTSDVASMETWWQTKRMEAMDDSLNYFRRQQGRGN